MRQCAALVCVLLAQLSLPAAAQEARILVLSSHDNQPYKQAVQGFKDGLVKAGITREVEVVFQQENEAVQVSGAALVLALGASAVTAALKQTSVTPIVAGMVVDLAEFEGHSNLTGVSLKFPFSVQLAWLHQFLPDASVTGILYSTDRNEGHVAEIKEAARSFDMEVNAKRVSSPTEISSALASLANRAHVLLGLPDQLVLTPQTVKHILLFSFRQRIPFVGLSRAWVKAGALYALDWDYADIGSQCGEMAAKILAGTPPSAVPPASPRTAAYCINIRTARTLKIDLPESLVKGTSCIYSGGE